MQKFVCSDGICMDGYNETCSINIFFLQKYDKNSWRKMSGFSCARV